MAKCGPVRRYFRVILTRRRRDDRNQELLLQNEYLAAENRILRAKLPARLRLNDPERATLAEIAKRVGRTALREIASVARPDTILAWYGRLIAKKFDGSKHRQ
jgi:putative transposase